MKILKIVLFIILIINISKAQEKKAAIGFYLKPGVSFLSKNTFTQKTLQSASFEYGGGIIILKKFLAEYSSYYSEGRNKTDNSKENLKLNTLRVGLLNTFPIQEKIDFRVTTGLSYNSFNLVSTKLFGYYASLGFEREISDNGLSYFYEIQYDLVNYQNEDFSGNLGGIKMFLGLIFVAKK